MRYVDLDIKFQIPSFSRSITVPSSEIFLIGGEFPQYETRNEVFVYDPRTPDRKLTEKAHMPMKKFDFSLCYVRGHIYVMGGKIDPNTVVATCEKYNVRDNFWQSIGESFFVRWPRLVSKSDAQHHRGVLNKAKHVEAGPNPWRHTMTPCRDLWCPSNQRQADHDLRWLGLPSQRLSEDIHFPLRRVQIGACG